MEASEAAGIVVVVLIAVALAAALSGWALMVAIGVLFAHGILPATLSYGPSVAVAVLVNLAFSGSSVRANTSK